MGSNFTQILTCQHWYTITGMRDKPLTGCIYTTNSLVYCCKMLDNNSHPLLQQIPFYSDLMPFFFALQKWPFFCFFIFTHVQVSIKISFYLIKVSTRCHVWKGYCWLYMMLLPDIRFGQIMKFAFMYVIFSNLFLSDSSSYNISEYCHICTVTHSIYVQNSLWNESSLVT